MNDELYDDIKKKIMLPLTIELHYHEERCFITPQSPLYLAAYQVLLQLAGSRGASYLLIAS